METQSNIGGIQKIEIAFPQFVQISKPDETNTVTVNITGDWKQLKASHGTLSFNDEQKTVKQGFIVNTKVQWGIPRISPENHQEAYQYSNRPIIAKITDNNGNTYIIGSPDKPAYILVNRQIPEGPASWNGYQLSINWQNPTPAPFVR